MKSLALRLAVALTTFAAGVFLTLLTFDRPAPRAVATQTLDAATKFEVIEIPGCDLSGSFDGESGETPEEKAVRLAEEFVARNGYTDLPPDRNNLSYESIEWASDKDKLLWSRHDSLERKAYGIRRGGKMGGPGWTVVFKPKGLNGDASRKTGRAVTMDGDFNNLRVEHKDFFLAGVHKKF